MNKKEFIEELKNKTSFDEAKCSLINDVLENYFIFGKNNKEKIVRELAEKLNVDSSEADNIYNMAMEIISGEIKDSIKHPFKSKD